MIVGACRTMTASDGRARDSDVATTALHELQPAQPERSQAAVAFDRSLLHGRGRRIRPAVFHRAGPGRHRR
jgi:hypothetical protein